MEINPGKGIVLNRMYVGTYLFSNLGHEVINFYTADNGKHYVYLNSTGDFAKVHKSKMGYMIFTKYVSSGCLQILGIATGLKDVFDPDTQKGNIKENKEQEDANSDKKINEEQLKFIKDITYGGVHLYDIFNEAERQNVYVTYEAENVYRLTTDYYIYFNNDEVTDTFSCNDEDKKCVLYEHNLASTSLKQYIKEGNSDNNDYEKLKQFINKIIEDKGCRQLGDEDKVSVSNNEVYSIKRDSIFDICQIQNSETAFSNALAYFMMHPKYKILFQAFFANHNVFLGDDYSIKCEQDAKIDYKKLSEACKEKLFKVKVNNNNSPLKINEEYPSGGRIDLLIRTKDSVIVVENKIKSDINRKKSDGDNITQLQRYYNYAKWITNDEESEDNKKKTYFIILSPKYNNLDINCKFINKTYIKITYKGLYNFLSRNKSLFENDINFMAFYETMKRHTYKNVNDYLYYEMQNKFYNRIINLKRK